MPTSRSNLTPYAQHLRRNMTPEEIKLWALFLKRLPVTVRRQKPIGPYILDFYIAAKHTAIELDGSQHFEEAGRQNDVIRDHYLREKGIAVLRYTNSEINDAFPVVCSDILNHLGLERLDAE